MLNGPVRHIVKQSVLYTCVLSQPLAFYADANPVLQNDQVVVAEHPYTNHDKTAITLQQKSLKAVSSDEQIGNKSVFLTEHALQNFQDKHHLTITNQANQKKLNTVIDHEDNHYIAQLEGMSQIVGPDMNPADVEILQRALDHFGYYQGSVDGLYGPLTQKAVVLAEKERDMELIDQTTAEDTYEEKQISQPDDKEANKQKDNTAQNKPQEEQVKDEDQRSERTSQPANQNVKKAKGHDSQHQRAIKAAREQIGTPYNWGGESPEGFDCSGFIQYIFQMEDISVPRTVSDMWNFTDQVDTPSIGNLVFFETYKPGPSHMGIYIGDDQFIHAGESRGVEKSKLSNSYWNKRYIGAGRIQ